MNTAVNLVIKTIGTGKLDQLNKKLVGTGTASVSAANGVETLTGKVSKSGQQIKRAANGLEYWVDAAGRARKANGRFVTTAEQAAAGIKKTGAAAKGAAGGVSAFGAALKSAVAPLALVLGSVTSLTAGFQILSKQNFAEAKFRSLGGDSEKLTVNLKALSSELKGQASTVELTGAAYDVASAGFIKASDATKVLKAASLGATGGFSDINTVANATTSVLNAYGLSADNAGKLVDGFIQTQNDGKIVIGEYARNIGKLAPIAAALNVPLEDINGAIAAVTANGLNAEIGITALRSSLAKLGANSNEATDLLAKYGVTINATTIGQEGLLETFKKLSKVTNKEDLLKIVGTEAGQAIAPLLNNLEKLERLIANQGNVAGVAANAQQEAANTIQGAWTEVSTAFSNLFSEQSELAEALVPILQGVADAVSALNSPLGRIVLQVGLVTAGFVALNKAIIALKATAIVGWFSRLIPILLAGKGALLAKVVATKALTVAMAKLNAVALLNPWVALAAGVTAVGVAAYNATQKINDMRDKMNDLSGSSSTLQNRIVDVENEIEMLRGKMEGAGNGARGMKRRINELKVALENLQGQYSVQIAIETFLNGKGVDVKSIADGYYGPGGAAPKPKSKPVVPTIPTGGGKGKGGGKGAKPRESELPQLQRELELSDKLLQLDRALLEAQFTKNQAEIKRLSGLRIEFELEGKIANINAEKIPDAEKERKRFLAKNEAVKAGLVLLYQSKETQRQLAEQEEQRLEALQGTLQPIQDEITLLKAKLNGNEEEIKQLIDIRDLKKQIAANGGDPSQAEGLVKQRDELAKQAEAADKLKAQYESLANSISSSLTGAFRSVVDGSKSAEEALSDAFKGIADAFLDMAMKMIQEWIKMQIIGLVSGLLGGPAGAATGAQGIGAAAIKGFANGGRPDPNKPSIVGERGPELFIPDSAGTVIPKEAFDAARSAMGGGGSGGSSDAFADNNASISTTNSYMRERSMETNNQTTIGGAGSMTIETQVINSVEYATVDQVRIASAASAKQARAQVFSDLKNKPASRAQIGMR